MNGHILVAGAGPTGLTLAITLRRFGVPVRIIDRLPEPAPVSKALVIWSGSMEAMQGMGVVDEFLAAGNRLHALRVGDGTRQLAEMKVGAGIDSPFPFPVLLSQARTESILRRRLGALGVDIERGVELVSMADGADGVTATLRHPDGTAEDTQVPWLAGCDGARSPTRHAIAGDAFEGLTEPQSFLLGDVRIDGGELDSRSLYIWWHNGGTVALFPFETGLWRVFTMRAKGDADPPATTLEELQQKLDRHGPPGLRLRDPVWLSVFRINERLAQHYRKGRLFIAGDAAHIHSPAGGQGMNTGIQDAVNLGWKLAHVWRGLGDAELLLDSYEAERRPTAHAVIDDATQRQHLAFNTSRIAEAARSAVVAILGRIPAVQRMLQVQLSETAIVYRDGPLVALGAPPRRPVRTDTGSRALDAAWGDPQAGTNATLWPLLSEPRHTLLLFEDQPGEIAADRIVGDAADAVRIVRFDAAADPRHSVRGRYRMRGPGWVLIRPDQVVAARGDAAATGLLDAYLQRVVRPQPAG